MFSVFRFQGDGLLKRFHSSVRFFTPQAGQTQATEEVCICFAQCQFLLVGSCCSLPVAGEFQGLSHELIDPVVLRFKGSGLRQGCPRLFQPTELQGSLTERKVEGGVFGITPQGSLQGSEGLTPIFLGHEG